MAADGRDPAEATAGRFDVLCFVALLPGPVRPAALDELAGAEPDLFHLGFDPPTLLAADVVAAGSARARVALARTIGPDGGAQQQLAALDDPDIDAALRANPRLSFAVECVLRVRDPGTVACGPRYRTAYHHRALLSTDPRLAAAALVDRRGTPEPTAWAAAWRTVRRAGGEAEVRRVLAGSLAAGAPDPVTADVIAALAEAEPGPHLDFVDERLLGTGALLRRLRSGTEPRRIRDVLAEPYRIDWALIAADHLREPLPRHVVAVLAALPGCPPPTAYVLVNGRPPRPGHPVWAQRPAPPRENVPARAPRAASRARDTGPRDIGPLGPTTAAALAVLRSGPAAATEPLTWQHVSAAVESDLLAPADVVAWARSAAGLVVWTGQESGAFDARAAPLSGRSRIRAEVRDHLAGWCAPHPPPPGTWRALRSVLRGFPGTLPELLRSLGPAAGPGQFA